MLLEAPLSSGAAAGSSGVPRGDAVGRQESGGGDEEDEPDEEELLLRDVFGGGVTDDKAFFEVRVWGEKIERWGEGGATPLIFVGHGVCIFNILWL